MYSKEARSKVSAVLIFVLLFSMILPAMAFGATAVQLKDIADSYAQKEIQALVDTGIISGYEDGTFQPKKAMSRAELAKIIVLAQGLKENADKASAFADVDKNSWYRGFVGALVESGITQGTSATTFSPDAKVTREELVVFFVRALGLEGEAGKLAVDAKLSDLNEVSSWAKSSVSLAFKIGFVNGIENKDGSLKFSPKDSAERQALARLAYEFKTNKSKFVDKAKETVTTGAELAVSSASAVSNTSVEVTFNKEISSLNASDFTFDNGLTVTNAAYKSDSKSVVVLTTSSQTLDQVYKLSYKGKDSGVTIKGVTDAVGGGGSSRSKNSNNSNNQASSLNTINAGGTINGDVTITSGGPIGPADGSTATINGTLTLDPGAAGVVTLQNVVADNIIVASGDENSIHLKNVNIKVKLTVNANNQTVSVRVVAEGTTIIAATSITSKATIQSDVTGAGTGFGTITINPVSNNQVVSLKGNIKGAVTVTGSQTVALNVYDTVSTINAETGVSINTASANANVGTVQLNSANANVSLKGAGIIQSIIAAVEGATLNIADDIQITKIKIDVKIKIHGNQNKIKDIKFEIDPAKLDELLSDLVADIVAAIKLGAAQNDLSISYQSGDSASSVTQNLQLPLTGSNGSTVAWASSNAAVISASGVVTRQANDTLVTLTATITVGGLSTTKTFAVTVKAANVTNPATLTSITSSPSSVTLTAYGVTQPLTITATYSDSTTVNVTSAADYSGNNPAVAKVNSAGVLSVGNGSTVVTVTYGGKSVDVAITVSAPVGTVTSVTYVTYNTSNVTNSVYGGQTGANNSAVTPFHIPADHNTDYLIVQFNNSLATDVTGVSLLTDASVLSATYTVENATYLAIKYSSPLATGAHTIAISGLKDSSNAPITNTVTFYVYQD